MTIILHDTHETLVANGFILSGCTSKLLEYKSDGNCQFLYLYKKQGFPDHADLVVHPDTDLDELIALQDIEINKRVAIRFGSNLKNFPKRLNNGQKKEHHGKALYVFTSEALLSFSKIYK